MTTRSEQPKENTNEIVMMILKRIGDQPEFKEAWKNLPNAERNYLCGDIYNIVSPACIDYYHSCPHPAPGDHVCIGTLPNAIDYCCKICKTKEKCELIKKARKAREDVLDDIWKFVCTYQQTGFDGFPSVKVVNLQVHLESLRQSEHGGSE